MFHAKVSLEPKPLRSPWCAEHRAGVEIPQVAPSLCQTSPGGSSLLHRGEVERKMKPMARTRKEGTNGTKSFPEQSHGVYVTRPHSLWLFCCLLIFSIPSSLRWTLYSLREGQSTWKELQAGYLTVASYEAAGCCCRF